MNDLNTIDLDVAIIGGGVAGLFTLWALRERGYHVHLFEKSMHGAGQSIASQGIIHGGTKYNLLGQKTAAAAAISGMPDRFRALLAGSLSAVQVNATTQYLWGTGSALARFSGFFAKHLLQSKVQNVAPPHDFFSQAGGQFYALDEPVLEAVSLLNVLIGLSADFVLLGATVHDFVEEDNAVRFRVTQQTTPDAPPQHYQVRAKQVIVTAGQGNADFANTQARPLQMFMLQMPKTVPPVFLHVLGASDKPLLTITTHQRAADNIWYIGGQVAEQNATQSSEVGQADLRALLAKTFRWYDFSDCACASHFVTRYERASAGKRPDTPQWERRGRMLIAWPTKLAFAPLLADELCLALADEIPTTPVQLFHAPAAANPYRAPWQ